MKLKTTLFLFLILSAGILPIEKANSTSNFTQLCNDAGFTFKDYPLYQAKCINKFLNQTPTAQLNMGQKEVFQCYCLAVEEKNLQIA